MESFDNRPRRPRFTHDAPKHGDETGGPERETEVVETSSLRARRPSGMRAAPAPPPEPPAAEPPPPEPEEAPPPDKTPRGSRR